MRILYGVVGEGMGHATRSRVVLDRLVEQGHEVEIIASGRAKDFLAQRFAGVNAIHGLHFITEENRVRFGKTLWSNVLSGAEGLPRNIEAYFELVAEFEPEVVISDFESWVYYYAKVHRVPIFSIDNMQVINRCTHPPEVLEGEQVAFEIARAFVKSKLPFCDHYFITTFFRPPIRKERTSLHPPILRPQVLEARPSKGDYLLVYQTAEGHGALARALQSCDIECRVYGMHRGLTEEKIDGNLRHRAFSEAGFIADLVGARAVVAGGGFTVMSESVYLHKPMLVVPLRNQFEQILNARWLEHLGWGKWAQSIDDDAVVRDFLDAVPRCEERLAAYAQNGNEDLFAALDEHLDRAAAGLY